MKREEIYERMNEIFKDVFDDDQLVINDSTSAEDIEDWDSLTHVTLIVNIENAFGIKFSIDEMSKLKNVGDIVDIISSRGM